MKKSVFSAVLLTTVLALVLSGCLSTSIGIGPVRIPVYKAEPPAMKKPVPKEEEEEKEEEEIEEGETEQTQEQKETSF